MKKTLIGATSLVLTAAAVWFSPYLSHNHELCDGFFPDWDVTRSVEQQAFINKGGIDEATFNAVLDKFEEVYRPIIKEAGGEMTMNRKWDDDTVNASAQRGGGIFGGGNAKDYIINMYGGLARHESITPDGFMVVVCHEVGHHIGGAPKVEGGLFGMNAWASNEGQSDYYAGLHCFRKIFNDEENLAWVGDNVDLLKEHPLVLEKCGEVYEEEAERALCARTAMAGFSVTSLFAVEKEGELPEFSNPDEATVEKTDSSHPAYQCRLDTYFASALCTIGDDEELSQKNPNKGTCTRVGEFEDGVRPLCWYKPTKTDPSDEPDKGEGDGDDGGGDGGIDICDILPIC